MMENMRKIYLAFTGMLVGLYLYGYKIIPEYKIQTSISMESQSDRQTILQVIVYRNHHDQELPGKIEEFFMNLNGSPTELQMNLYFEGQSKPYKTVDFKY